MDNQVSYNECYQKKLQWLKAAENLSNKICKIKNEHEKELKERLADLELQAKEAWSQHYHWQKKECEIIEEKQRADYVYYIQGINGGLIKIGYTNSLSERIKSLQTYSPVVLQYLAVEKGGRYTEKEQHSIWNSIRCYSEWFSPHEQLLEYISTINSFMKGELANINEDHCKHYPQYNRPH